MTVWADIVKQHGGIIWKPVRRLIVDDADAADCFQEAFLLAWEYSRQQPVKNWPGLLKRFATIHALNFLRRRNRSASIRLSNLDSEPSSGRETASIVAEEKELLEELRAALTLMPADQAEVCCLRYLEGFRYEQIAVELGVTVNHVGVLLHRAKSVLQIRLAAYAPTRPQKNSCGDLS